MINAQQYEEILVKLYNMLDESDNVSEENEKEFLRLCNLVDEYEDYWFPLTP